MNEVPSLRLRRANNAGVSAEGEFLLCCMNAVRQTEWNFSLQRSIEWAGELQKPLVAVEPFRYGDRWASDRLHRFVVQGMVNSAKRLARRNKSELLHARVNSSCTYGPPLRKLAAI
jgi:deoxyribodipyrimidine photo-lyase